MMKRLFSYPLPKILLLIELVITLVISTNLTEVMDRYYTSTTNRILGKDYTYNGVLEIHINQFFNYEGASSDDYMLEQQNRNKLIKEQLTKFLIECNSLDGNVFVYPVGATINNGTKERITVFLSSDERIVSPIEGKEQGQWKSDGVYVGNAYASYVKADNIISIYNENKKVIGIMSTMGFEKNPYIYVKYNDLSNESKSEVINAIMNYINESNDAFVLFFQSNNVSETEFYTAVNDILEKYDLFKSSIYINDFTKEYILDGVESNNTFETIKYVFMVFSIVLCVSLLFRTTMIIIHNEKNNIFIMKTYGLKMTSICIKLFLRMIIILLIAVAITIVIELLGYYLLLGYSLTAIVKNMCISVGSTIVLFLIIYVITFLYFNRKNMAEVITCEEV